METPVAIEVNQISKKYIISQSNLKSNDRDNYFWALQNISFSLKQGDTLGIIGPNGSGKSTLLKILSQVIRPTSGIVHITGRVTPFLDLGTGFHPDLTGMQNIYMVANLTFQLKNNQVEKIIPSILEFSELGDFINHPVKFYSNGMYLRLASSIALFCRTDILLIDEIFATGDIGFIQKCREKMNEIIAHGTTMILASHNMEDIMRMCNKCLWIDKGNIQMLGSKYEVIAAYNSHVQQKNPTKSDESSLNEISEPIYPLIAQKNWSDVDAPQTKEIQLISVLVRNPDDLISNALVDYNQNILIEIVFEKKITQCDIGFTLIIADEFNTPFLATSHYLNVEEDKTHTAGRFMRRCVIPKRLLNIGVYKIEIQLFINYAKPILFIPETICFKVQTNNPKQKNILSNLPLRFASNLEWQLISI